MSKHNRMATNTSRVLESKTIEGKKECRDFKQIYAEKTPCKIFNFCDGSCIAFEGRNLSSRTLKERGKIGGRKKKGITIKREETSVKLKE